MKALSNNVKTFSKSRWQLYTYTLPRPPHSPAVSVGSVQSEHTIDQVVSRTPTESETHLQTTGVNIRNQSDPGIQIFSEKRSPPLPRKPRVCVCCVFMYRLNTGSSDSILLTSSPSTLGTGHHHPLLHCTVSDAVSCRVPQF